MMRKIKIGAAFSLVAVTSVMFANEDTQGSATTRDAKKCRRSVINPSANPQVKDGYGAYLYGDLLYWKAAEGGLPIAAKNENTPLPSRNLNDATIRNLRGKWDVGMRLGLAYVLPHDGWDLNFSWLHFNPGRKHHSMHGNGSTVLFPSLAASTDPIAINNACREAKGHWNLNFNQFDAELGREFFVSKRLTLRPHAGLRADWIEQKVKVEYDDFIFGALPDNNEVNVRYHDDWWGVGLDAGLDTQWELGSGWSILANLGLAILYGEHSIDFKEKNSPAFSNGVNSSTSLPNKIYAKLKEEIHIAHPVLDLQLGLQWERLVNGCLISVHAGWENHVYFSQNQFPNFCDDFNYGKFFANQGDLTLQGWTLGLRLDF